MITSEDTPVGIVTDRDLAVRVLGTNGDSPEQTAEDVMTCDLCTAGSDAAFYEATVLMAEH